MDQQAVLSVPPRQLKTGSGKAAQAGDLGQIPVQTGKVHRFADVVLQPCLNSLCDLWGCSGDFDELWDRQGPLALLALRHILFPLRIVKGIAGEHLFPFLCCGKSQGDDLLRSLIVRAGELLSVHRDERIRPLHAGQFVDRDHHADGSLQHPKGRHRNLGIQGRRLQVDRDHDVRTHGAGHVHRQVFEQSPIHVDPVVVSHRTEDGRQRHGGAQGLRQRAVVEDDRLAAHQVGGHAAEGCRQLVEAGQFGVSQRYPIEDQPHLVPGVEAAGKIYAPLQPEFHVIGILAPVFLATIGALRVRCLVA